MSDPDISHYRILTKLGSGGMGDVYLAEDSRLNRKVAIKFVAAHAIADERAKRRLMREAQAAAQLDHPNICSIFEVAEANGETFIVMQYVEGETLTTRLARGPLPLAESLNVAVQVSDAMVEAHRHGVIHRDIKPQNIILTPRGLVKVLDFGLAKRLEEDTGPDSATKSLLSAPGTMVGTLPYMSPEQVRGELVDERSDIFSFGVLLYEMLGGRRPFVAESPAATASAILTTEAAPLARYADVPQELQWLVRKCLSKNKEQRYQSARELLIDLQKLKRDSDAGVTSVGGTAANKISYRGWGLVGLAFIVLALGTWQYWRQEAGGVITSIAVLPFSNMNADEGTEYLADGIPENIINSLSQLPNLKVMSRNSVFRYKGREPDAQMVGRELKVQSVLTGRVAQRGESLSITVELVDTSDNRQIWGEQYNRSLADVFAIQQAIAQEITGKLRLRLTGEEKERLAKRYTENVRAYQSYMLGRSYADRRTRADLLAAIRYYERAIEEDHNYALAYAGLADAQANLGVRAYVPANEGRRQAEAAARQALALDRNLAEAHAALGRVYTQFAPYNFSLGDPALQHAIELSPSLAIAHQSRGLAFVPRGRLDESLEAFLKARELDPLSSIIARCVALSHLLKRDYPRALEDLRQANELGPTLSTTWDIAIYVQNGLLPEALAEVEKAEPPRADDPILLYSKGVLHAAQGQRAETVQIIKKLEEMSGATLSQSQYIAKLHAALGDIELTLDWLDRGLKAEVIGGLYPDEPAWDLVRNDRRFADVLRRSGVDR